MLHPPARSGGVDICHSCGQALPRSSEYLTRRELDVLTAWWLTDSVKEAARLVGVGEQRAKNLLAAARFRNRADSNGALLALHFAAVRESALRRVSHNDRREEG